MRSIQYQGQDDVGGDDEGRVCYIDHGIVVVGDGLRQDDGTADKQQEQVCRDTCRESRRRCT